MGLKSRVFAPKYTQPSPECSPEAGIPRALPGEQRPWPFRGLKPAGCPRTLELPPTAAVVPRGVWGSQPRGRFPRASSLAGSCSLLPCSCRGRSFVLRSLPSRWPFQLACPLPVPLCPVEHTPLIRFCDQMHLCRSLVLYVYYLYCQG